MLVVNDRQPTRYLNELETISILLEIILIALANKNVSLPVYNVQ